MKNLVTLLAFFFTFATYAEDIPYLTFHCDGSQTLSMTKAVETLEYSVNGGEWKTLGTNKVAFGGSQGDVRLRGNSITGTSNLDLSMNKYFDEFFAVDIIKSSLSGAYSSIIFGTEEEVHCGGDIRTLINYENYEDTETNKAKFIRLFYNCSQLISAPDLPSIDLADYCYVSMFSGCRNLTKAPDLPAEKLTEYCYNAMFLGCENLTVTPKIYAKNLDKECCSAMFRNCIKLEKVDALSASKLASFCYAYMFSGCKSLIDAPELPALEISDGCYYQMFSNCTNLKNAPKLPAEVLFNMSYASMFYHCESMEKAPEISALVLADYCCQAMFMGCKSLLKAPDLKAEILKDLCYQGMFDGCSKLSYVKMLATDISARNCLYSWLNDVAVSGTFVKSGDSKWNNDSVIPKGWDVVITDTTDDWTEPVIEGIPYLSFHSDKAQTLTFSTAVEAIDYSVNGGEWQPLGNKIISFGAELGDIRLRGKNRKGTADGDSFSVYSYGGSNDVEYRTAKYSSLIFATSDPVYCYGDIRTIIDYDHYTTVDTKDACFARLFYNCHSLITAPKLPLDKLCRYAYAEMFAGCDKLRECPQLPSLRLNSYCYFYMFARCIGLKQPVQLPASYIGNSSYCGMFADCENLEETPELNATELSMDCYAYMFTHCKKLKKASALPATRLSPSCYASMFFSCESLEETPELIATELAHSCYRNMFFNCANLKKATSLPATTLADYCYSYMFAYTKIIPDYSNVDFTNPIGLQGLFAWLKITDEDLYKILPLNEDGQYYLPAISLTPNCYWAMFYGSTIETSPVLPALVLSENCYSSMFYNCDKLKKITMLATDITASNCLQHWTGNNAKEGTFVKNSSAKWNELDVVPEGWRVTTVDVNTNGIQDIQFDISNSTHYDLNGYQIEYHEGFNIIRESTGRTKKVFIR